MGTHSIMDNPTIRELIAYKHGKHNQISHGNRYGKGKLSLARARRLRKAGELDRYMGTARERSRTKPRREREIEMTPQRAKSLFPSGGKRINVTNTNGKQIYKNMTDGIYYRKPKPFTMVAPNGKERQVVGVLNRLGGRVRFSMIQGDDIIFSSIGKNGDMRTESKQSISMQLSKMYTPQSGFYLQD